MELNDFFEKVGGSYAEVMSRFPNEEMVRRFLKKLIGDKTYNELKMAIEAEDSEGAFRAAHTLKGVAANLGLASLEKAASELTEALRGICGNIPTEKVAELDKVYGIALGLIEQL